jgi:hypothetical protein
MATSFRLLSGVDCRHRIPVDLAALPPALASATRARTKITHSEGRGGIHPDPETAERVARDYMEELNAGALGRTHRLRSATTGGWGVRFFPKRPVDSTV